MQEQHAAERLRASLNRGNPLFAAVTPIPPSREPRRPEPAGKRSGAGTTPGSLPSPASVRAQEAKLLDMGFRQNVVVEAIKRFGVAEQAFEWCLGEAERDLAANDATTTSSSGVETDRPAEKSDLAAALAVEGEERESQIQVVEVDDGSLAGLGLWEEGTPMHPSRGRPPPPQPGGSSTEPKERRPSSASSRAEEISALARLKSMGFPATAAKSALRRLSLAPDPAATGGDSDEDKDRLFLRALDVLIGGDGSTSAPSSHVSGGSAASGQGTLPANGDIVTIQVDLSRPVGLTFTRPAGEQPMSGASASFRMRNTTLVVSTVKEGSQAAGAGLEAGSTIVATAGVPVKTVKDFEEAILNAKAQDGARQCPLTFMIPLQTPMEDVADGATFASTSERTANAGDLGQKLERFGSMLSRNLSSFTDLLLQFGVNAFKLLFDCHR